MSTFRRPQRIYSRRNGAEWVRDGWWFTAFGRVWRVRNFSIYQWKVKR